MARTRSRGWVPGPDGPDPAKLEQLGPAKTGAVPAGLESDWVQGPVPGPDLSLPWVPGPDGPDPAKLEQLGPALAGTPPLVFRRGKISRTRI